MASLALAFDILARDSGASRTFKDVGNAAEDAGKKGERFGSRMSDAFKGVDRDSKKAESGFDRATNAADETETKFEGVAYTMSGTIDVFSGLGAVMKGDVTGGLIQMAMGGADLAQGFRKTVIPAIQAMTIGNIKNAAATAASTAGMVAQRVAMLATAAATKIWTGVQWLLNAALAANPIGLVVIAIAALVAGIILAYKNSETFRKIVDTAFKAIAAVARWLWNSVFAPMIRFIINGFAWIVDGIANMLDALGNIPGFGWAKDAADKMRGAADKARSLADNIKDIPAQKTVTISVQAKANDTAIRALRLAPSYNSAKAAAIEGRAIGGPVRAGTPYIVGEKGPEIIVPKTNGTVLTADETQAAMSSGAVAGGSFGRLHPHDIQALAAAIASVRPTAVIDGGGLNRWAGV